MRPLPNPDGIQALLFDVGNTLLSVPHDPHQRAIDAVSHLGVIPFAAYKAGLERARQEWRDAGGQARHEDLPGTWVSHIERALQLIAFPGDAALAARLIEDSFLLDGWDVYPEAAAVLAELRARGYRMGVISNWPATLEVTLETAGLRQYFEAVVVSGVEGYAKPRPEIFRAAFARLGIGPHESLYIGDSLTDDIEGAAAVGMASLLIDRAAGARDDHERITSLDRLLDRFPGNPV